MNLFNFPEKPILDELTRRRLTDMGLSVIRQSNYASGRRCPMLLKLSNRDAERMTIKALFGTVFHLAYGEPGLDKRHRDPDFYLELFKYARELDPHTKYLIPSGPGLPGNPATWDEIRGFSRMFANPDHLTMTLGELALRLQQQLRSAGHTLIAQELHLRTAIGRHLHYPIEIIGTADLITYFNGKYVLWDVKSSGLWDVYLENSNSGIKAASYSTPEITYHSQLRHYDWQLRRQKEYVPYAYGILAPTNLVPHFRGDKQGQIRGTPFFVSNSLGDSGAAAYEQDLVNFLTSFARPGGQYRAYPSTYGKIDCPNCAYFNACQGDLTGSRQAATLSDDRFSYLKD